MVLVGSGRRGQGNGVWPPGRGKAGSIVCRLQPAPFALAALLLRRNHLCGVQAGLLRRRASAEAVETVPPRPGSALKDQTGRRMLYGNPSFRFAQIVSRPCPRADPSCAGTVTKVGRRTGRRGEGKGAQKERLHR